jgi:hypothetical protein
MMSSSGSSVHWALFAGNFEAGLPDHDECLLDKMRRAWIRFDALSDEASGACPVESCHRAGIRPAHFDDDVRALTRSHRTSRRVVLCDIEGLSYEEIAATCSASNSAPSAHASTEGAHSARVAQSPGLAAKAPAAASDGLAPARFPCGRAVTAPAGSGVRSGTCLGEWISEYADGTLSALEQYTADRHLILCQAAVPRWN